MFCTSSDLKTWLYKNKREKQKMYTWNKTRQECRNLARENMSTRKKLYKCKICKKKFYCTYFVVMQVCSLTDFLLDSSLYLKVPQTIQYSPKTEYFFVIFHSFLWRSQLLVSFSSCKTCTSILTKYIYLRRF